jgi:hypothetical protein
MPTIDLTDDEHGAVVAAIRRFIDEDRFPRATPRPAALKEALGLIGDRPAPDAASFSIQSRTLATWLPLQSARRLFDPLALDRLRRLRWQRRKSDDVARCYRGHVGLLVDIDRHARLVVALDE